MAEGVSRREETLELLRSSRLVAALRFQDPQKLPQVAEALVEAGVKFIEISMTTPMATTVVADLRERLAGRAKVGAGGVTGNAETESMLDAGADFISTPIVAPMVVARCRGAGAVSIIGSFTPTEAWSAFAAQADFVGIFPAGGLGPGFINILRMNFPRIRVIPAGGISLSMISDWLSVGATAVTVGSKLIDRKALENDDWAAITEHAKQFVDAAARRPKKSTEPSSGDDIVPGEETNMGVPGPLAP